MAIEQFRDLQFTNEFTEEALQHLDKLVVEAVYSGQDVTHMKGIRDTFKSVVQDLHMKYKKR